MLNSKKVFGRSQATATQTARDLVTRIISDGSHEGQGEDRRGRLGESLDSQVAMADPGADGSEHHRLLPVELVELQAGTPQLRIL